MRSPYYERGNFDTDKQGDECDEERFKKYLDRKKKQLEVYEDQIVAEMSLSEIIAGKRRIKRDAQMQREYNGEKLHLGTPATSVSPECFNMDSTNEKREDQVNKQIQLQAEFDIDIMEEREESDDLHDDQREDYNDEELQWYQKEFNIDAIKERAESDDVHDNQREDCDNEQNEFDIDTIEERAESDDVHDIK